MNLNYIKYLPAISFLWLSATVLIGGINYPNYNHISQFISELGANGAPNNIIVNYLGLVITEVFLIIYFTILLRCYKLNNFSKIGIYLLLFYCYFLVVAAVFPIEYEFSTETYSISQKIHTVAGGLAYLMGIVGIIFISFGYDRMNYQKKLLPYGVALGLVSLLCFVLLNIENGLQGLFQRILEISVYLWLIIFSFNFRYKISA